MATYKTHYKLYDGSTWNEYYFYTSAAVVSDTTTRKWVPWSAGMSANQILMSQSDTNGTLGPQWVSPTNLLVGGASQLVDSNNSANSYTYSTLKSALDNKQPLDADLTAIAALSGTSGLLKKTAANTWSLDTTSYATSDALSTHTGNTSNPHSVTKAQVGLGSVVNAGQSSAYSTAESNANTYFTQNGAHNMYEALSASIADIVNIAEGKSNTYVVSYADNTAFNSQADTITATGILRLGTSEGMDASNLNIGDIIYVTETNVPDRWVGAKTKSGSTTTVTLYKLETSKVDLTNYVTTTTLNNWTGSSKITTVGTIGTGTWNGTVIDLAYGGLGVDASTTAGKTTARSNLGLGNAATYGATSTVSNGGTALVTAGGVYTYINTTYGFGEAAKKDIITDLDNVDSDTNAAKLPTAGAVLDYVQSAVDKAHKVIVATSEPSSGFSTGDILLQTNGTV